jgi:hypothetical protein
MSLSIPDYSLHPLANAAHVGTALMDSSESNIYQAVNSYFFGLIKA